MSADPIHLKEADALLSVVEHLSRNQKAHGLRTLILSDRMCVALAASKGRANNRTLNRLCQRIAAEVLASNIWFSYRWVASERICCDQGSRLWERLRPGKARALDVEVYHIAPPTAGHRAAKSTVPGWAA